ncbi:Sec-independent protein translocase protein TatB [Tabrizicola sp.]|uniref:Sec-independent protein translocase protein TatB n=1 Tax=Tabrizicola sp. TaxID=2005166 RepID=UPI0027332547|nr:Sec-independent protein translocase protein TatB [Tabrizicola sp.]MDP3197925.1 Sec-independent protein translocase protein TatB [Tabrizicola sp.]
MDFSWSELLIVGIVALIVIGPKDLPGMFRELGRFTAKIRSMGREFSRAMEQAAKESGVKDVADDLRKVASPKTMGLDAVKSAADKFEKWDPMKNAAVPTKPLTPPPMTPPPMPAAMSPGAAAAPAAEAAPAAAPGALTGPATAALYEKKAARKAVLDEASAKLRSLSQPETAATTPEPKAPGRRRKKPDIPAGDAE